MQQTRAERRKQKRLALELETLRAKHKGTKWRVPLPDLKCESKAAPLGNNLVGGRAPKKSLPADAQKFPTGNLHKSGEMLVTPGMIAGGELKYVSGKKF